jgi:hypothetical protein
VLDLTDALRRSLTDHATDAPGAGGLDARVYARSRRLAWRQRGLVAATVALLLAVAAPVVVHWLGVPRTDTEPPAVNLVKYPGPTVLPVRVTYVPPLAAGFTPVVTVMANRVDLGYGPTERPVLVVTVQTADPAAYPKVRVVGETIVNGVRANLVEWGPDVFMIAWKRTPDAWTMVWAHRSSAAPTPVDEALLRPVAEGLTDGTTAGDVPFTLDLIPRGYVLGDLNGSMMRLCPAACATERNRSTDITVEMVPGDVEPLPGREVAVGTRAGRLIRDVFGVGVWVPLEFGRALTVWAPNGTPLTDEELVAFAAGITVTPYGRQIMGR